MLRTRADVLDQIAREGKLTGIAQYRQAAAILFPKRGKGDAGNVVVGQPPDGFVQDYPWDRTSDVLVAAFINPADPLGIVITGAHAGDTLIVHSCTGIATFSEDSGNPLASSIVSLVAKGADAVATALGHPEASALIEAAEGFAQDQFKPTDAKYKPRDAFGEEPATGLKARQEGGILISLPLADGPYYSGNGDHTERWIKKPGDRTDRNRPVHVVHGFFPRRNDPAHNARTVNANGEIFITAWDWKFADNAGYYKVYIELRPRRTPAPRPTAEP